MTSKKMRVLLSAFACHPQKGSEEGVGWNWLKEISRENEVYAIICSHLDLDQENAVKAAVEVLPQKDNIHLTFIPLLESPSRGLYVFSLFDFYLRYVEWQKQAYQASLSILENIEIDIVHHVTYASWLIPGFLWKLPKPFILGPVSGSQRTPWVAYSLLPSKGIMMESVRMIYFFWSRLSSEVPKEAVKKASIVLYSNFETFKDIKKFRLSGETLLFSEVGAPVIHETTVHPIKEGKKILLLWSGLIQPRKNFGLLLEALRILPSNIDWELHVLGSGELIEYWKDKVVRASLDDRIIFLGQVPYADVERHYQKADIFVFPSLREGTPTAIIEAMAYGLPVVALRLHGAAVVLDNDCGILIDVMNKKQMINDFAEAIVKLAQDSDLRIKIGKNAIQKIQSSYTWEQRRKNMMIIYQKALNP